MISKRFLSSLMVGLLISGTLTGTITPMEDNKKWDNQKTPALQPTIFCSKTFPFTLAGYAAAGLVLYAYQDKLNPFIAQALVGLGTCGVSRGIAQTKRDHIALSHYCAFYGGNQQVTNNTRLEKFKNKYEWWNLFAAICPMVIMEVLLEKDVAAGLERPFRTQLVGLATSFTLNFLVDQWGTKYKNVPQ